ncbi:acyltransferase [Acidovorax sp. FJL06]|uniref:acyltransferase family protein n=1 Tax=Acidovorax sp. FJL06 TaxID=2153365 RepID=UPI001F32F4E0|nr:acyltransferase [Acidovorax sp. FJL06]
MKFTFAQGHRASVIHSPQHRANNFDALRLLAAVLVIWSHQFALMGRPTPLIFGNEPGALGVVLFFAISGYLVTQSWVADPHVRRFAARRALRIWPGLTALVLLSVFVLGPLLTELSVPQYFSHKATWQHLLNLVLQTQIGLPGIFASNPHPGSLNGPLWTIPIEVGCYAALALVGWLGLMRWRWFPLCVFLALAGLLQWRYSAWPHPEWSFALQYAMIFAVGSALSRWESIWLEHPWVTAGLLLAACSLLYKFGPSPFNGQSPLIALAGLGVVWGACCTPVINRAGRFGDFSYGLYIYGFAVQQIIIWGAANQLSFGVAFVLSIIGALFCAALSWHFVEKPALRWKPQRVLEK